MAWPPPIPPNTRQNVTPELDNHPSDHNLISNALTELVARSIIQSGGAATPAAVPVAASWTTLGTFTIPPVTVPSRLFMVANAYIWGAALTNYQVRIGDLTATTLYDLTPTIQSPASVACTAVLVGMVDLAANANPSFLLQAIVVAGGGSNTGQGRALWLQVAR